MIEIKNICKKYGKSIIIDDISMTIANGQVYCLLGKNGVGKTTLINLILDIIQLDSGSIQLLGRQNTQLSKADKRKIGVVNESLLLIDEINGYEYLSFVGSIYNLPADTLKNRIADLFQYFFEDSKDLKKNISKYSTGMKKKLAFCAAVIHTPDILILDEPFSGLDPLVANQMVLFLKKYQRNDRVILISSHDLSYVEKVSTHIGVLDNHKLVFNSTLQSFTESGNEHIDSALLKILQPNDSELQKISWV